MQPRLAELVPPVRGLPLIIALALGGCIGATSHPTAPEPPVAQTYEPPAVSCPWVDGEHDRGAAASPGTSATPLQAPPGFQPGCAIIRFTVAADGIVSSAALRAAYPITNGPVALAALQHMRFQPAQHTGTQFVIRLGLQRDATGHVTVAAESRHEVLPLWAYF